MTICSSLTSFLQERLTAKKAQLVAYDAAITALNAGVESYTLDTGQTEQKVTRSNIQELQNTIRVLENDIVILENRLNCKGGVVYGRPT